MTRRLNPEEFDKALQEIEDKVIALDRPTLQSTDGTPIICHRTTATVKDDPGGSVFHAIYWPGREDDNKVPHFVFVLCGDILTGVRELDRLADEEDISCKHCLHIIEEMSTEYAEKDFD